VLDAFTYDAVGSTVSHVATNATNGASSANDFVYDARGRLIQANTTLYKINALEQRIEKQGFGADTPSGTRHFVYDEAGHLIGEYDPVSGNPMIEHVWLETMPIAAIKNGSVFYVYPDHLGTPRAITDTANQTVWYWNYDEPFGATEANENPNGTGTFTYNLRFPGQYFDAETGLHYNWHRDYNPEKGKYIQSDPIGLRGGLNTYGYAEGSPIRRIDPLGLSSKECCDKQKGRSAPWIGGGVGGGGMLLVAGGRAGFGVLANLRTGEVCAYILTCLRLGAGFGASAGLSGNINLFGPYCGKDFSGVSCAISVAVVPGAGGRGNFSISCGAGVDFGAGSGNGAELSGSFDVCYMQIVGCWNTPCECS